jgi:adenine-specific DNA-methyltransferase
MDQKGRGAFFTPLQMAEPMVHWAVRSSSDLVLDGGAGESVFLAAAAERLLALGAQREPACRQIYGVELDELSAKLARKAVASALGLDQCSPAIKAGSFFDQLPGDRIPQVNACIGNPPYIRYQAFSGEARRTALLRAAEGGVKLNGLASSWAPFLVHTCRFLTPEGRLAQVLPAELLQTGYAEPIRDFLVHRFRSVLMVVFDARVFPGALEEVVLLLAGEEGQPGLQVREVPDLAALSDVIDRRGSRTRSVRRPSGKWTKYLLQHGELASYESGSQHQGIVRLSEYGRTEIGVVTGANGFFVLDEKSAKGAGLSSEDLRPAICKAEQIQGLRLTKSDMAGLAQRGQRSLLFYPVQDSPTGESAAYIRSGEWVGLHHRYKCRTREPWWRVPGLKVPDLFVTYMSNEVPRLVANEARSTNTNTVHGVHLHRDKPLLRGILPILFLNSLTLLSAEIEGRSYGGGVLKLEPKECDRLLVPRVEQLPDDLLKELRSVARWADTEVRAGNSNFVTERVDQLVLIGALGFSAEQLAAMRSARQRLLSRRRNRMTTKP